MTKISLCMVVMCFIIVVSQGSKYRTNRYYKDWKPQEYKHGETVSIVCREEEVIRVSSAKFRRRGRPSCHMAGCNPKQDVQNGCNGKSSCNFTVDSDVFGENCNINKAGLLLQYKCIPDPCLTYCCANGGQCQLTDPRGDNFDPMCTCINGYEGKHCEECDLAGSKIPCAWRNRTFNTIVNGGPGSSVYLPADGTRFHFGFDVFEVNGSFIITRSEFATVSYGCFKVDVNQSTKDYIVYRTASFSLSSDFCTVCAVNENGFIIEFIAQDSDATPIESVDNTFCDSPEGCPTTGTECDDNGSLDFGEKCPE